MRGFYEEVYKDKSHVCRQLYGFSHYIRRKHIAKFFGKSKPGLVLDCGCGIGLLSLTLCKLGFSVISMDISLNAILQAKTLFRKSQSPEFIVADAQFLPFRKETFDYLLCSEVLEHVENDKLVLNEFFRILKSRSHLLLTIPLACNSSALIRYGHLHSYSIFTIVKTLLDVGFKVKLIK